MAEPPSYTERFVQRLRRSTWTLKPWSASAALFARDGSASSKFHGQAFDPDEYDLIEEGWSHDHCPFCSVTICDAGDPGYVSEAYTNGYDWVCPSCHAKHLSGLDA
jgi:hypothetical protein